MLKDYLLVNWDRLIGVGTPSSLQVVPISSCLSDYGNDVVLLFVDNNDFPDYVMKISRSPKYGFKLKNEFYALSSLTKVLERSDFIPVTYCSGIHDQNTFFIQGGVPGASLLKIIQGKRIDNAAEELFMKAVDLLAIINSASVSIDSNKAHHEDMTPDMIDQYGSCLIGPVLNERDIDELRKYCNYFSDINNNYFLHGDYWQTNIMIMDNKICGIIDWEFSMPNAKVPTDIIWFLINIGYCLYLRQRPTAKISESFAWSFFTTGDHSELICALYRQYIEKMGLAKGIFAPLVKLTLLKMSLRELLAYGRHANMDFVCLEMLEYFIQNEKGIYLA